GRRVADEALARSRASRRRPPDAEQRRDEQHALDRAKRAGQRPSEVLRAVARDHRQVEVAELMGGEHDRGAEALDLERPARLAVDAGPDAVRRKREEWHDDDGNGSERTAEAHERLAPTA